MFKSKKLLCLVFLGFLFFQSNILGQNPKTFSFTLGLDSKTSAGVFFKDGTLIRTLWSGVQYDRGVHAEYWDGLNDDGTSVSDSDIEIKVLSNNVSYMWEGGVIGNTSEAISGPTKYHSFEPIGDMVYANGFMYCTTNYNEGYPSQIKFDTKKPQSKFWVSNKAIQGSQHVATDGNNIYWSVYDPFNINRTFVFASKVSNDEEVTFSAGSKVVLTHGTIFNSVIGNLNNPNGNISSLAVKLFIYISKNNSTFF